MPIFLLEKPFTRGVTVLFLSNYGNRWCIGRVGLAVTMQFLAFIKPKPLGFNLFICSCQGLLDVLSESVLDILLNHDSILICGLWSVPLIRVSDSDVKSSTTCRIFCLSSLHEMHLLFYMLVIYLLVSF